MKYGLEYHNLTCQAIFVALHSCRDKACPVPTMLFIKILNMDYVVFVHKVTTSK